MTVILDNGSAVSELDDGGDDIQEQGQPPQADCQAEEDLKDEWLRDLKQIVIIWIFSIPNSDNEYAYEYCSVDDDPV